MKKNSRRREKLSTSEKRVRKSKRERKARMRTRIKEFNIRQIKGYRKEKQEQAKKIREEKRIAVIAEGIKQKLRFEQLIGADEIPKTYISQKKHIKSSEILKLEEKERELIREKDKQREKEIKSRIEIAIYDKYLPSLFDITKEKNQEKQKEIEQKIKYTNELLFCKQRLEEVDLNAKMIEILKMNKKNWLNSLDIKQELIEIRDISEYHKEVNERVQRETEREYNETLASRYKKPK